MFNTVKQIIAESHGTGETEPGAMLDSIISSLEKINATQFYENLLQRDLDKAQQIEFRNPFNQNNLKKAGSLTGTGRKSFERYKKYQLNIITAHQY